MKTAALFFVLTIFISFAIVSPSFAAQLSFQIPEKDIKVGQSGQIDIMLSGGEDSLGTDIILTYDSKMIDVVAIKETSLYPNYQPALGKRIDPVKGKITLSGSANFGQPVKASGIFANIFFQPVKSGTTKISFDYEKDATNKTDVIDFYGNDLLTSPPSDLNITIKSNNIFESLLYPFKLFLDRIFGKK